MIKKYFNIFSYVSIALVTVFLVLMLADFIPVDYFVYILAFSILLLIIRLVFRVYFLIEDKKKKKPGG